MLNEVVVFSWRSLFALASLLPALSVYLVAPPSVSVHVDFPEPRFSDSECPPVVDCLPCLDRSRELELLALATAQWRDTAQALGGLCAGLLLLLLSIVLISCCRSERRPSTADIARHQVATFRRTPLGLGQ
jgi:hypothetical protein